MLQLSVTILRYTKRHWKTVILIIMCRFVIGREKNPGESEVARLIEQSIAEDKIRDDMRQRQQDAARQVPVLHCHFIYSYGVVS